MRWCGFALVGAFVLLGVSGPAAQQPATSQRPNVVLVINAPLFHRKDTLWEGGIRVPAIFRWPGRIPAGKTSAQAGITMDLTASILAATSTTVPPEARLEGVNLLPILEGRAPVMDRTLFWRIDVPLRQQRAVRSGEWKLLRDGDDLLLST